MNHSDRFHISNPSDKVIQVMPRNGGRRRTSAAARQADLMAQALGMFERHCGQTGTPSATNAPKDASLLLEIQQLHAALKHEQMSRVFSPANDQNINLFQLMTIAETQMIYGRRDHARCEHLLHLALVIRDRLQQHHEAVRVGKKRTPVDESNTNLDRLMAQQVVNLMLQASNHNPDDSAYSLAWRNHLQLCSEHLSQAIEAALRQTAFPYHSHPNLLTGKFRYTSVLSQAEVLKDLQRRYGFNLLRPRGLIRTLVAFSPKAMQIALVDLNAGIRYINMMGVARYDGQLPIENGSANVDDESPPSVSFDQQRGGIGTAAYSEAALSYVMGG